MESLDAATAIAAPLGSVGAAFYFSPEASARAEEIGIDVVSLYAAGRGGVLGELTPQGVDEEFFFFKPGMIGGLVAAGRASAEPEAILAAHLASVDDYARSTFGGIDNATLTEFDAAASAVLAAAPTGSWALADGYRAAAKAADPAAAAYLQAVILREVRGGVHRDAVVAAGLTGAVACQFDQGDGYYRLHGFGDADRVEETPEIIAAKGAAEQATNEQMAALLSVLDDDGRTALLVGADAMLAAVASPVPVA